MTLREDRSNTLFDILANAADGRTMAELVDTMETSDFHVKQAIRDLRDILADDEVNVVCDVQPGHQPHVYRLVGNYADAKGWYAGRLNDMMRRATTMHAVAASIARGADQRTVEGKRAAIMERRLGQMIAEVQDVKDITGLAG
jgi:hypothetical protein